MQFNETDTEYCFEGEVQCSSCKGTGLYVGMAEREGCAVVCQTCNGTGVVKIRQVYQKFSGRKKRKNVNRVFETAGGYCIADHDVTTEEGETIHFSKFGVSYEEWLAGGKPKPIEDLHCPYQHTCQDMQSSKHPANKLYKEKCSDALNLGSYISKCGNRKNIKKCWKRYHELMGD